MSNVVNENVINDKPLATLILLAFNQENYIRESIKGALSQTYEPLEIIMSDDSSTDRTFEIMHEMVSAYQGPHQVKAVRQTENLGTVNHVITLARLAKGNILIVNAGDDISYKERTTAIVDTFLKTGASCVNSSYDEINKDGDVVCQNLTFPYSSEVQTIFANSRNVQRTGGNVEGAIGFAASYNRNFWADLPFSKYKLLVEDGLATVILNCLGLRFVRLNQSLIAYRIHDNSLSLRQSRNSTQAILQREKKIDSTAKEMIESIDYAIAYISSIGHPIEPLVLQALRVHQNYGRVAHGFWVDTLYGRLARLTMVKSKRDFLFVMPRVLGEWVFVFFKRISLLLKSFQRSA